VVLIGMFTFVGVYIRKIMFACLIVVELIMRVQVVSSGVVRKMLSLVFRNGGQSIQLSNSQY
jgi:hypothetical protein